MSDHELFYENWVRGTNNILFCANLSLLLSAVDKYVNNGFTVEMFEGMLEQTFYIGFKSNQEDKFFVTTNYQDPHPIHKIWNSWVDNGIKPCDVLNKGLYLYV